MCRLSRKAARLVPLGVSPAKNNLAPCLCRTGEENAEYIPTATIPNAMIYFEQFAISYCDMVREGG